VTYRLALDHRARVTRVAVLDVLPTLEHYRRADAAFGDSYWHWFFLAQPFPVPETLIAGDPDYFFFGREWKDRAVPPPFFTDEALAAYRAAALRPAFAHALCEDYRAGATFDVAADEADAGTTRIRCPLLVLWGTRSFLSRLYDPVGVWQDWCDDVHGEPVDSGHYLAEERPEEVLRALRTFFMDGAATC
jgi:haloacetate dehalogenase